MNGIYILLTILLYFGILLLVARLTGRHSDNDAFFRGNRRSPWYIVSFGMIGASLSGVTFVSVPGMVRGIDMTYMQTCFGFFIGYLIIAHVLLPLYYRLNLTSIYTYLGDRIGRHAYKTGASFFLLSKIIGAAARLYLVCLILQHYVFDAFHIPFAATVIGIVLLIWLYTRRSGIRTIVWTDSLQTLCLLLALGLILYEVSGQLNLDFPGLVHAIRENEHSRIFVFDDWHSKQNFFKQFFSGIFITIVMTGLDQDMMQKNLSCKNLREAQKNMYCYGISFVPVNFLFLSLGILLLLFASQLNIPLPAAGLVCGGRPSGIRRTDILYHRHHCSRLFQRRFGIDRPHHQLLYRHSGHKPFVRQGSGKTEEARALLHISPLYRIHPAVQGSKQQECHRRYLYHRLVHLRPVVGAVCIRAVHPNAAARPFCSLHSHRLAAIMLCHRPAGVHLHRLSVWL